MPESEKYISYAAAKWHLYHELITNKEAAKKAFRALSAIPAADVVSGKDFRDCRNELCLKCGNYKQRHLGACDGCRWRGDNG